MAWPWILAAVVVIGVLTAGILRRSWLPAEAISIRSVAVLPVQNLTGEATQDFFAEGITDGLITELGSMRAFDRVTSRSSTAGLDLSSGSLAAIGERLAVDGIVEASVLSVADAVRLNVRLVYAASDDQVWSGSFEGDPGDVTTLYRTVARALVAGIGGRPSDDGGRAQRAVDPAAYAAYVRGRHFWGQRTPEGYDRAAEYFREAIAIDDGYAAAYAGLADNYFMADQPTRAVATKEARNYAATALALDDSLAEAHTTLAFIAVFDWQWQTAEEGFRRAIELNPSYTTAHHWYGLLLSWLGRFEEADAHLERARQLDPLSPLLVSAHAAANNNAGRFERALEIGADALALDPEFIAIHGALATAYTGLGEYEAATEEARAMAAGDPTPGGRAMLARVYAAAGRSSDAQLMLAEFDALGEAVWLQQDLSFDVAEIYAAMGERDRAIEYLERAYEHASDNIVTMAVSPWLVSLRQDPRFDDLLRRMGLRD
jgi:TolB-like protein/tetratricopeptide (TPR) repeat protein